MNQNYSEKRQRAESEFASIQYLARRKVADAAPASAIDERLLA